MKNAWEIKTLNQIAENLDSKRIPITQNIRCKGEIPYYGASGIVDYVENHIFNEELLCVSEDGANLLARTYPIAFSISGKTWVNNHAHVLKFSSLVTQKYVEKYLNYIRLDDYVSGMAQPKLNQAMLNKIPIPLPPLPEQQRIVAILDEAFAGINRAKEIAEQNLRNAREIFDSYLNEVFANPGEGWLVKTIADVIQKTENIDPTKKPNEKFIYLDVSAVNKETKVIEDIVNITGKDAPSRARKLIKTNDVIFATVRPTHNRVTIIPEYLNGQVCSTGYFVLRPKEFLDSRFVYYFLLTYKFNQLMEKLQKGASYPAVTDTDVKNVKIPFPEAVGEQRKLIQMFDTLYKETLRLRNIYSQKLIELDQLEKSILQKAFNGELKTAIV